MLRLFRDSILALVFPQDCRVCGSSVESYSAGLACFQCWQDTRLFTGKESACSKCGHLLNEKVFDRPILCHRCDDHQYDMARSAAYYEKAIKVSVLHLKEEPFLPHFAKKTLLERFDNSEFYSCTRIIPVPLSPKRMFERGFNQAEILSACLGKHTDIRVEKEVLVRTKHAGVHRAGMDRRAREESVRKTFAVINARRIRDECVLLVDDVFTSGATASSCADALKKQGAAAVSILTLARTPFV